MKKIKRRPSKTLNTHSKPARIIASEESLEKVNNAAAERIVADTGEDLDNVRQELAEALAKARIKDSSYTDARVERMVERVIDTISDEEKALALKNDNKIFNLMIDLKKAKEAQRYTTIAIINRQMEVRGREVIVELAEAKLKETIENGDILNYIDEDIREAYAKARCRIMLVMDVLDSCLLELTSIIQEMGLKGELHLFESLVLARAEMDLWGKANLENFNETCKCLMADESEGIYRYIKEKRAPVLMRKINKVLAKREE